jgi:hypothetical protein
MIINQDDERVNWWRSNLRSLCKFDIGKNVLFAYLATGYRVHNARIHCLHGGTDQALDSVSALIMFLSKQILKREFNSASIEICVHSTFQLSPEAKGLIDFLETAHCKQL